MPGDLRVSLRLTAEDLMSPAIVEALTKLQLLEQATVRVNTQQQAAAGGAHAHAAAQAEVAEQAGLSARALEAGAGAAERFGEEMLAGAARMGASLIGFELVQQTIEKVTEAAREAEVANRQLTGRFGEAAGEYREFSEQAAQGTNFTAVQFERAASALQPLTRDYGLTNEELQALLRTTADLAAANGVDLATAANGVAGVLRGQTRAGTELGLNIRANVIASMDGLTDAEKRAAAEGDNVASAHARLRVIELEAAGAHGQAAQAAGEAGDQFARLDKATADLYETLAASSPVASLAGDLATAATSGANLVRIVERLNALDAEARAAGGGTTAGDVALGVAIGINPALGLLVAEEQGRAQRERNEAAARRIAGAGATINTTQALAAAMQDMGSRGVPPVAVSGHVPNAVYAATRADEEAAKANLTLQEAYRDETVRILNVTAALDHYTAAQEAATRAGVDFRDETTRAIEVERNYGNAMERSRQQVGDLDVQLRRLESARGVAGGYERTLEEDRALRRRMGLPELAGETAMIRELIRTGYRQQLAEGPAAMAAVQARLAAGAAGLDPWDVSRVTADRADITVQAANITVQGAAGGARSSAISGSGLPAQGPPNGRYAQSQSAWPWWVPGPGAPGIGRALG